MLPILSGVLFKADKELLNLSATDLEISIRTNVAVKIEERGSIVVPARLISDILNNLQEETVEMSLIKERSQLEILAGESRFDINILYEEDFPKIPVAPEVPACSVNPSRLNRLIREVVKAASKDEAKPILSGVLTEINKKEIKMVATDSYRLAICEERIEGGPGAPIKAIIPSRSLREIGRIISAISPEEVSINLTDSQIIFRLGQAEVVSRLIEGEYPHYQQLLPESYEKKIRMDKEQLIGAVRRASLLAQDNAPIKLTFGNNLLVVSASTQDVGEATERMHVEYPGDEIKMAFNPGYFLDGVASVEEEELLLEIADPLKPALIRPAKAEDYLYLVMPVRIG
jgi:DNA polymerase-3 subunit beta